MEQDTRPHTQPELDRWAYGRQPHEREDVPAAGERLLFREHDFGTTVPAVVAAVQDINGTPHDHWNRHGQVEHLYGPGIPDPNVWEPEMNELGPTGRWLLKDDPWPWVSVCEVRTAEDGSEVLAAPRWCREARVRGSAGWLRDGSRAHTGNYGEEVV